MLLRFGDRFSLVRKLLSLLISLAQYFIPWADNRRNILEAARKHLKTHRCDAIIATGEPFILFRYAQLLSKEFSIPWVADYRDGWSTDYTILSSDSQLDTLISRLFYRPIEQSVLRSCYHITCASPALKRELEQLHPHANIKVVYNGYFPELFEDLPEQASPPDAPFVIAYSGTLYSYQMLELFIDGASLFINERQVTPQDFKLLFIGMEFQDVSHDRLMSYAHSILPFIETTPRLTVVEAIDRLNGSDAFLLLANRHFSPVPAKLFDYLALGKPVLMCENDRAIVEDILISSKLGLIADTPQEVCAHIGLLYDRGFLVNPTTAREKFSRKHQAAEMSATLKGIRR
jgi:glycosyltransferase involved in cell wall biosynthesis